MRQRKLPFDELVNQNREELMKDQKAMTEIEEYLESRRQADPSEKKLKKENAK
ncbi:FbpB family small basic protein [Radiobacillus deserti]|uniref:FbpB family small basic protein n=1 Tax=Radiobacillus deserti TaxID=2594883 RepID=A0A516KF52_9BACI|nr:FbpB family small basic protein [Radiobacillus deserti]QDP40024.1 FbpB family small basic protein [Radiobacillus deserti]